MTTVQSYIATVRAEIARRLAHHGTSVVTTKIVAESARWSLLKVAGTDLATRSADLWIAIEADRAAIQRDWTAPVNGASLDEDAVEWVEAHIAQSIWSAKRAIARGT